MSRCGRSCRADPSILTEVEGPASEKSRHLRDRRCLEGGAEDVINEALRQGLALGEPGRPPVFTFRLKTVAGRLLPGVDLADRDKLFVT
jgi:hypothetical protein